MTAELRTRSARTPGPLRIIELWTVGSQEILQRVAPLLTVVRGTVGADPDLARQWQINESQRRTAYRALADLLAGRGALRPGLRVQDAANLAFLIASAENYMVATNTLGWAPGKWRRTTASLLANALLRDPPGLSDCRRN